MLVGQYAPQNFTYTSRATELGRGPKTGKMDSAPEWTPGPGEYPKPTEFSKKTQERYICGNNEGDPDLVEIVPSWD
jgi:hypothetical protein